MTPPGRAELLARDGTLLVLRDGAEGPDLFVALSDEGDVTGFCGHVDLGTGISTALAQIVAEELDVPVGRVRMVLGHTGDAPNQGPTIASETIQITAIPLRKAAASARAFLIARAAEILEADPATLAVDDGAIRAVGTNRTVTYAELISGQRWRIPLDEAAAVKPVSAYRIVGRPVARVDIPAKVTGEFTFIHDVRVEGMLHGRVVRPPYGGRDAGEFIAGSLISVDETSVSHLPGFVKLVVIGDFVGVVCEREEQAIRAAEELVVTWRSPPPLPDLNAPENALRANPSTPRRLLDRGDVDAARAGAAKIMDRTYVWPYQMHASIGPSCSVAHATEDGLVVWSGTQNPHMLRADLARLMNLPEARVEIIRHEAAGCYGRNCADDVGGDAALLSRAVGRPVRVQLSREQEHVWEPKGTAQVMDVAGALDAEGRVAAYDFATRYPSNGAPLLGLILTGAIPPNPAVLEMGDRTSIPPYAYDNARVTVHDMPPIVRASWFRGVSALPNSFAHESWIDECAAEAGIDPVAYRLSCLEDERGREVIRATAERAGWVPRTEPGTEGRDGDVLYGRGMAYAVYVHGKFPGVAAAWSAWVTDVAVDRRSGEVAVTRVVAGQDTGLMINPAGVRHQLHGNIVQSTSRVLKEEVTFTTTAVASREWGSYPLLTFPEVPAIDAVLIPRPEEPPLGAGESASVPSAAAIANAIYDATGVRFRELPFTPDRIRAALGTAGDTDPKAAPAREPEKPRPQWGKRIGASLVAALGGGIAMAAALLPLRPAYAPIARPDPTTFSAATIEKGRLAAALGGCVTCHTGENGRLAGGLALETPFGRIVSTNITPDPEHGIGAWSYPAFERAMREGVSRDGHHLYPAHPFTDFTKASDADLQAIYAWLMAQPAIARSPEPTSLAFPFSVRPLMAAWNALFLRPGAIKADPARSAEWNRGAYLVEGLGHCGGCHTPRNALGGEQGGPFHLGGGEAQGWHAPALTALSRAPVPWSEQALYDYLRTGFSALHGPAAGPMAPVVSELQALPDSDIRAMATYLTSLNDAPRTDEAEAARKLEEIARTRIVGGPGARLFEGACAVCHEQGTGPVLFGVKPSLALNTNVRAERPDNLIHVILHGVMEPARPDLGYMPGFGQSLDDRQIAELARYIRARFGGDAPAWTDLEAAIARLRSGSAGHGTVRRAVRLGPEHAP